MRISYCPCGDSTEIWSSGPRLATKPTQTLANATIITKSFDELLARQSRLEMERDNGGQIAFPKILLDRARDPNSEAARAIAAERSLFDLRQQARGGQKAQLRERTAQLQEEIKGYLGQAEAKQREVDFVHKELEGVRTLFEKRLVPMNRLTALERDTAKAAPVVAQHLRHWLADPDFSGLRAAGAQARLPEEERAAWASLWAAVADLLGRVQQPRDPSG